MGELKYALLTLARRPGFALFAVLQLALGIGAVAAVASLVDALLMRPLALPGLGRIVAVWGTAQGQDRLGVPLGDFLDLRERNRVFSHMAVSRFWDVNATGGDEPEQLQGALVSPSFFRVLETAARSGRVFLDGEQGHGLVVVSDGLWRRRFGADPGLVGRTVLLGGASFQVVGVLPPEFDFPLGTEIWSPLALGPQARAERGKGGGLTLARLRPGVTLARAQAEMDTLAAGLARQFPDTNAGRGVRLVPLRDQVVGQFTPPLLLTVAVAVGFVLLIACGNVAMLELARGARRQEELAVRAALGAGRGTVARQLLAESLLVSLAGGALGLCLAVFAVRLIQATIPHDISRFIAGFRDLGVDGRIAAFTVAVALATTVASGLAPALRASRPDLAAVLKQGGKGGSASLARHRLLRSLVVAELTLALVGLIGAGLMMRGLVRSLGSLEQGLVPRNLLTMRLRLPPSEVPEPARAAQRFARVLEELERLPGVRSAAAVSFLPAAGGRNSQPLAAFGQTALSAAELPVADVQSVSPGYFATLGIPLLAGRPLTWQDREGAPAVALVSRNLVRRLWPGEDPLGKRVRLAAFGGSSWVTVVGVTGDVKHHLFDREPGPTLYLPLLQAPQTSMDLAVRTVSDPMGLAASARAAVLRVDADQPVDRLKPMEEVLRVHSSGLRLIAGMMGVFGAMALVFAAAGVYGVIAYTVAGRRKEIGLRLALGAQRRDVMRLVAVQALKLGIIGVALGIPASFATSRLIAGLLFGVFTIDWTTFAVLAVVLVAVSVAASSVPAWRASQVDPASALNSSA